MKRTPLKPGGPLKRTPLNKVSKRNSARHKDSQMKRAMQACRSIGHCERCNHAQGPFHAHHILYRSQAGQIAHEPLNLICLCPVCHQWAHNSKPRFEAWIESNWPGRIETLKILAEDSSKLCGLKSKVAVA